MSELTSTVLLIENDQATRELYQRTLGRDFEVFACAGENEALNLLLHHSIKLIIFEPYLESREGWAFLASLHTMPQTNNIPVIVCTTLDEQELGIELGATRYLVKPVLPLELLSVSREVIFNRVSP